MKCCVIGDGGWGTALALVLDGNGHAVTVWGPFDEQIECVRRAGENRTYLPGVKLPDSISWTSDAAAAVDGVGLAVLVVPSRFFKETVQTFSGLLPADALVVSAAKGFEEQSGGRMSQTAEALLSRPVAVLSGPSHAEEVACGVPTAVTVAAQDPDAARTIQELLMSASFRVYTSTDVIGVELGGALKNVIALAAGINDGMELGDNSKAALMTRGLAEITRLGTALGARPETFAGLSGLGDLMVTCASRHSRNRSVGERLGRGEKLEAITGSMKMVAEGVWNTDAARRLAREAGVETPIIDEIWNVVHAGKDPGTAVRDLMTREGRAEQSR
jgi:glycerol-3-phosphate dehydrogenase (NAD(P)+)